MRPKLIILLAALFCAFAPTLPAQTSTRLPIAGSGTQLAAAQLDVSGNADKLALTHLAPGALVRVTDEGNRLEVYLGGGAGSDANWLVRRNAVRLLVTNTQSGLILVAGVNCPAGQQTLVGWIDPTNFTFSSSSDYLPYSVQVGGSKWICNGAVSFGEASNSVPLPCGPRALVTIVF